MRLPAFRGTHRNPMGLLSGTRQARARRSELGGLRREPCRLPKQGSRGQEIASVCLRMGLHDQGGGHASDAGKRLRIIRLHSQNMAIRRERTLMGWCRRVTVREQLRSSDQHSIDGCFLRAFLHRQLSIQHRQFSLRRLQVPQLNDQLAGMRKIAATETRLSPLRQRCADLV